MRTAGVAQVKARFSEYLAIAKAGEAVLITERGKPVAQIGPINGQEAHAARILDLARRGVVKLGTGKIPEHILKGEPVVSIPDGLLERIMEEEREDRV